MPGPHASSPHRRVATAARPTGTALAPIDDAAAALAELWERHRKTNLDRVATLENVAAGLLRGALTDGDRQEAESEAHKLAGSLGTFGFLEGTRLARELESSFVSQDIELLTLTRTIVALRDEVEQPRPTTDAPASVGSPVAPRAAPGAVAALLVSADVGLSTRLAMAAPANGVELRAVEDSETALAELKARPFKAALVDIKDDGDSGHALIRRIAALYPDMNVSAIATSDTFDDRLIATKVGAHAFLSRSLTPNQMLSSVGLMRLGRRVERARIVAIDDDESIRDLLCTLLASEGHDPVAVSDPHALWQELESQKVDLLVLDVEMPEVSGLLICRAVRADPRWQRMPILVLTARTEAETMNEAFRSGADDFVSKPVVPVELRSRVRAHVERGRLLDALTETDSLTGVAHRWKSEERLAHLLRLANRQGEPLALALLDLDRFKQINDSHGHRAGDDVLRRLGDRLIYTFREEDVIARWGGEEFVLGMYAVEAADCVERVASLLEGFRSELFTAADGAQFSVSFSAGVAQFPLDGSDLDSLYGAADAALYRAKLSRGRVVAAGAAAAAGESDQVDVLVVEDDEAVADLLTHALATRGYEVAHLGDGAVAAEELGSGRLRARLVLLDIGLPGLDGFAVLRHLRDHDVLDSTRVIALTARAAETETLRALELGALDHVSKPFSVPVLMRRIHHALENRS